MKWTESEIEETIKLIESGLSYAEVSEITNRKANAIRIKMNRLGIKVSDYAKHEIKHCLNCGEEIKGYGEKFCSHSCSASFNNKIRKQVNNCLMCGEEIPKSNKYCSNLCQRDYERKIKFTAIENGDNTLLSNWYKKYLIELHGAKCMKCGWSEKNPVTNKVPIELDHIDGNSDNNELKNLRLLCPNCHSLTPTYKSLNNGNGRFLRRERYKNGKS